MPFYTRRANGIGLGLSFCKKIMLSFGGDISCISEEGQYTEFQLNFPNYNT
ncbi:ATP-binding protein [Candidatus Tisiphia endosymbiont of Oplodontha viridula]|uniref:ATP-binding protein n=1 Tax=Candidatus Tisiphia endosymbiont of Oplodontha viridula TaxID=3077925 RepID=UPI0039773B74